MKIYLIVMSCFVFTNGFCQVDDEAVIKVDSNLTMRLHDLPKQTTQKGCRILFYSKDNIVYQVVINDSLLLSAKTKSNFDASLAGIRDGYVSNGLFRNYSLGEKDSLFDKIPGKFIHFYNAPAGHDIKEAFLFVTLQNSHAYMILVIAYADIDNKTKTDVDHFFKMLEFKGLPYDEFPSKKM